MKETYKRALDKAKSSEIAKKKAYSLYDTEFVNEKIAKPKKKKYFLKGAIAASIVAVLMLGSVLGVQLFSDDTKSTQLMPIKNSFIVTANAEEITKEKSAQVMVGEGGASFSGSEDYESDSSIFFTTDFEIKCEGENIDTVTYTSRNIAFYTCYLGDESPIIKGIENPQFVNCAISCPEDVSKPEYNTPDAIHSNQYTSFTVHFENQPSKSDFLVNIVGEKQATKEQHTAIFHEGGSENEIYMEAQAVEELLSNAQIDVEVKFVDGTTQTKTVVMGCEAKEYMNGEELGYAPFITFTLAQ